MTLVKYQPRYQTPFFRMISDIDRIFNQVPGIRSQSDTDMPTWYPSMDITEDESRFSITADLPGMTKKDIELSLTDDMLTISGERKSNRKSKDHQYVRSEVNYGKFTRSFSLPENVKTEDISAEFSNGVLTLTLPKAEPVHPPVKQIEIK